MTALITSLHELHPGWLTEALLGSRALQSGQVIGVRMEQDFSAPMSNITCVIGLDYSTNATGTLPKNLFFKNGRMRGEVSFYQHVAPFFNNPPAVECHYTAFENDRGQSNLLLDDIRPTHRFIRNQNELSGKDRGKVIEALAEFHRSLWEHPALKGSISAHLMDLPHTMALRRAKEMIGSFADVMGDQLSAKHKQCYGKIFSSLPHSLWQARRNNLSHVTVVHGDVHIGNIALPKADRDSVKLLDWSLWHINLPAYDLSYFLALRTDPATRSHHEKQLLTQYHSNLNIPNYSLDQLLEDYRLSILFQSIWPVFFHSFTPKETWMPLHKNIMQAFEDWHCEEFLK